MTCVEKPLVIPKLDPILLSDDLETADWDWSSKEQESCQRKVVVDPENFVVIPDRPGSEVETQLGSPPQRGNDEGSMGGGSSAVGAVYDIFLSHLQRNAQDAVISLQMFVQQLRPDLRCFIDLDVDMKGDLTGTLMDGVANCRVFLFFITDGVLSSPWCLQEIRWAVEHQKTIVLVRETDARHGGIEMNEFLKQVPSDLMETFSNIIAIPWYRQPAFRAVSVDSILKACALEDSFAEDMKTLDDMRAGLQVVAKSSVGRMSCFDFMGEHSWAMRWLFFLGGFQRFRRKRVDQLYTFIFGFSFLLCAIGCFGNLVYQGMPFHHLMTDAATALAHIPAFHAWRMWRSFVRTPACDELLYVALHNKDEAALLARLCRFGGWIAFTAQVLFVIDVYCGLAAAWTAEALGVEGLPDPDTVGHMQEAGHALFCELHIITMWVVILPTVASFFASHCMFVFLAALHIFDLRRLDRQIIFCMSTVANFFTQHKVNPGNDAHDASFGNSAIGQRSSSTTIGSSEMEKKRFAMEKELSDLVIDVIRMMFTCVQDRIDKTCEYTNSAWLGLLVFATYEILAVRASIMYHLDGGDESDYEWWYFNVDFWHLGGGSFLLIASLSLFAGVTTKYRLIARRLAKRADEAGCPLDMQAKMLSFLSPSNLGTHMFGGAIFVDAPQVGVICFVTFTIVGSLLMSLLNHLNSSWV